MYVIYKKYTLNMKTNRLKGWRSIFKANTTLNKAVVTILISKQTSEQVELSGVKRGIT